MDAGDLVCMRCASPDGNQEDQVHQMAFEKPKWEAYWDDPAGRDLRNDLVEAARTEELAVVRKMVV